MMNREEIHKEYLGIICNRYPLNGEHTKKVMEEILSKLVKGGWSSLYPDEVRYLEYIYCFTVMTWWDALEGDYLGDDLKKFREQISDETRNDLEMYVDYMWDYNVQFEAIDDGFSEEEEYDKEFISKTLQLLKKVINVYKDAKDMLLKSGFTEKDLEITD